MAKLNTKTNIDKIKTKINNNYYSAGGVDDTLKLKNVINNKEQSEKSIDNEANDLLMQVDIDEVLKEKFNLDEVLTPLKVDENNKLLERAKQIKKKDINSIFKILIENLGYKYSKMELYSGASNYLSVDSTTFYKKLSSEYKEMLIVELNSKSNYLKKRGVITLY